MNTKILILLATLAMAVCIQNDTKDKYIFQKFEEFVKANNKQYSSVEEFTARFQIFKKNYEKLELFTFEQTNTHRIRLNKFADMTEQEFRKTYLNLNISVLDQIKKEGEKYFALSQESVPASWDWREQGAVGNVKDQGRCGSCWAFSAVANLEGLHQIKHGESVQLSEQQLVDCDKLDSGCHGGLMENTFNYLKKAQGIVSSSQYKYRGIGGVCQLTVRSKYIVKVTGHQFAEDQDEEKIKEFLYRTGPLSIAINADSLQFYDGGIIDADSNDCDPQGINHGVAIVGYGSENGQDFWIVRNSWGETWGENGYFRIARGKGTCGVNTYVISAKIQ